MPTIEFSGDDTAALDRIRARGYCSYSSIKCVRDKEQPSHKDEKYFKFGKELHSRHLEKVTLEILSVDEEKHLRGMGRALESNSIVRRLMTGARVEVKFFQELYGINVLGHIDIWNRENLADLKTTYLSNPRTFAAKTDMLQAAIYLTVTGAKNFYYIGICKLPPYKIMIFNVNEYPERLAAAKVEMKKLLKYIKSKL